MPVLGIHVASEEHFGLPIIAFANAASLTQAGSLVTGVNETSGSGARTDVAAIKSELEVVRKQLTPLSTRPKLPRTALGIILPR